MLPGDRLVCAFMSPHEVGDTFREWYLHVTVVPWFRLPDSSNVIAKGLEQALQTVAPFEATGNGEARFGPRKNRPVRLLEQPTPFTMIEQKVRTYLHKKRAWLVDETTKVRQDFRPHVTSQESASLGQGEKLLVQKLYIVEQKGDSKEIVSEISLYG